MVLRFKNYQLAPRFYGPIRLNDEASLECETEGVSVEEISESIDSFNTETGASAAANLPTKLYPVVFEACLKRLLLSGEEGDEKAGALLLAMHPDADEKCKAFLNAPFYAVLDAFLFRQKDDFGMALESINPDFCWHQNDLFMKLLWGGFEILCESPVMRLCASRIFPLMIFTASCPEDVFEHAVALSHFAYSFGVVPESRSDHVLNELKRKFDDTLDGEKRSILAQTIGHYMAGDNPKIITRLLQSGIFTPAHFGGLPNMTTHAHSRILDLLSILVSVGYAGAPGWAELFLRIIDRYVVDVDMSGNGLDEFLTFVFYRTCAISEPFHLARRLVTVCVSFESVEISDTLRGAIWRFLKSDSDAITKKEAHLDNHKAVIGKLLDGLTVLLSCQDPIVRERAFKIVSEINGSADKRPRVSESAIVPVEDSPYLVIDRTRIHFIESHTNRALYEKTVSEFSKMTSFQTFRFVQSMLDPLEENIMGTPQYDLIVCFDEESAKREQEKGLEGKRLVLMK